MQENVKGLQKGLTQIKGFDRKRDVFRGITKIIKNWMLFLPIIEDLKKDSMNVPDDRHWKQFKKIL